MRGHNEVVYLLSVVLLILSHLLGDSEDNSLGDWRQFNVCSHSWL